MAFGTATNLEVEQPLDVISQQAERFRDQQPGTTRRGPATDSTICNRDGPPIPRTLPTLATGNLPIRIVLQQCTNRAHRRSASERSAVPDPVE
jgi:hypothetical protein